MRLLYCIIIRRERIQRYIRLAPFSFPKKKSLKWVKSVGRILFVNLPRLVYITSSKMGLDAWNYSITYVDDHLHAILHMYRYTV